jgi:serine/threonine protein kinase
MNEGDRFGPWTLKSQLGSGGNATVWLAEHADRRQVALKLINTRKADREPYKRFIAEINFLVGLGLTPGVVPVLDHHLPERPSRSDRPWLAMELAQPIREALAEADLGQVVDAMGAISATLARLAAAQGVAHRDIKPANLYRLNDNWCVGDFGLVALPEQSDLTQPGRPLGPAHFLADEMLRDPVNADPFPADVYALGKTLWVLACRQNFPPQGHQPVTIRGNLIADYAPHPHAAALDRLVDRMTEVQPQLRPTMAEVAAELQEWGELADSPPVIDLSATRARLHESLADQLSTGDVADRRRELALAAVRQLQELTRPLNDALRQLYPRTKIDQVTDDKVDHMLKTYDHGTDVEFRWARLSSVAIGSEFSEHELRMGRAMELTDKGELLWHAFVDMGPKTYVGDRFLWQAERRGAPVGTVTMDKMLHEAVRELAGALERGAEALADRAAKQKRAG